MITADQLVLHAVGDYFLQSDWMANNKTKNSIAAALHATLYTLPFLLLSPTASAVSTILLSHFLIDRFRLARYLAWLKNWLGPNRPWAECRTTGYPAERPTWLAVWLMIITDNVLHVVINGLALHFL